MLDTRAVKRPIAQPRRKEPRNIPQKLPMDLSKETTVNLTPSTVYTSTDLREHKYNVKGES